MTARPMKKTNPLISADSAENIRALATTQVTDKAKVNMKKRYRQNIKL